MDGKISTVAGNGTGVFSGDGGPASSAPLSPDGVAVAGDGTLYTADHYQNRIRRVGVDGKISTVAGNGTSGFSGDGGPASSAQLYSPLGFPSGVAVAGDGTLYISDVGNNRIRKVTFATAASPAISSLSPAAATAGGPGLTLTVTGSGFVASSTVQWNGGLLATTYVNAAQLTAAVPTGLVASSGTASVAVTTPGSGTTGALIFTITPSPPGPSITSLSPASAIAGGSQFSLTVNGAGFTNTSKVQWNGASAGSTFFISANQLQASISNDRILTAGTASITVQNANGAISNAVSFTITPPAPPFITSLSPSSATAGGAALTLRANGTGFSGGSNLQWNGSALPTSFELTTNQLIATIPASLIATPGTASLTVIIPTGTVSNTVSFPITGPDSRSSGRCRL